MAGGMMRFGIPRYRLAARRARRRGAADPRPRGDPRARQPRSPTSTPLRGEYDAVFLAVGAQLGQARLHPGRVRRPRARRGRHAARRRDRREAAARPPGRRLRRRQHRDGRRPDRQAARCLRGGRRLPAHPGPDAGPRVRDRRGGGGGRAVQVADHDQAGRRRPPGGRADGARRRPATRSPPGSSRSSTADSLVLALGQETDLSLLDGVPGPGRRGRRGQRRART